MGACPKCGKARVRKSRDGKRRCRHCGPLRSLERQRALDAHVTVAQPVDLPVTASPHRRIVHAVWRSGRL